MFTINEIVADGSIFFLFFHIPENYIAYVMNKTNEKEKHEYFVR